mgnify:CR=1 FL=1
MIFSLFSRYKLLLLVMLFSHSVMSLPEWVLPEADKNKHLGVASCATSVCHGKAKRSDDSNVWLNEYRMWTTEDRHARAYKTLKSKESRRIAKNLGLKSAHTAKICLDCHADNTAKNNRGPKFQISDGVGCEGCHGGSEQWIESHTEETANHADNLAKGMFPTETGVARARLCLSCHYGTKDKLATHQIMGAGHPRLSFELETFTANQPAHYAIDDDYVQRKGKFTGFNMWVVGQFELVKSSLNLMDEYLLSKDKLVPELYFYDCHACHHPMSDIRWAPTAAKAGLPPGVIRLNDANLLMLVALTEVVEPNAAKVLQTKLIAMHKASIKDKTKLEQAIIDLSNYIKNLDSQLAGQSYSTNTMRAVRKNLVSKSAKGEYRDFSAAEQAFLAVDSITIVLNEGDKLAASLDQWYDSLSDENRFSPKGFATVANKIKKAFN